MPPRPGLAQGFTPVQELLITRRCTGCDLQAAILQGLDLSDVDLQRADLRNADLREVAFFGRISAGPSSMGLTSAKRV
ncbi:MAG: pentapeptide repeat-containing protein [Leptolyngbya sp. RL_3_1]|nr:pentapeptide repeat-containing protein [Leptolyngbya sp. RL_3_1]